MYRIKRRPKLLLGFATVAVCLAVYGSSTATGARVTNKKVAVLFNLPQGPFSDIYAAGISHIRKAVGRGNVAIAYNLQPSAYQSAMTSYATRGYGLVILTSDAFTDAAKLAASANPHTKFVVINGSAAATPNLTAYNYRWEQAGLLAGIVAGLSTRDNKVGAIHGTFNGVKLPPIVRLENGYIQGVRHVNHKAKVTTTWIQSFTDPTLASDAAQAQLSKGIDTIWVDASSGDPGAYQVAKSSGKIRLIGYGLPNTLAPKQLISSLLVNYSRTLEDAFSAYMRGSLKAKVYLQGYANGVFSLDPTPKNVPAATRTKIATEVAAAKAGKIRVRTSAG